MLQTRWEWQTISLRGTEQKEIHMMLLNLTSDATIDMAITARHALLHQIVVSFFNVQYDARVHHPPWSKVVQWRVNKQLEWKENRQVNYIESALSIRKKPTIIHLAHQGGVFCYFSLPSLFFSPTFRFDNQQPLQLRCQNTNEKKPPPSPPFTVAAVAAPVNHNERREGRTPLREKRGKYLNQKRERRGVQLEIGRRGCHTFSLSLPH